MSELKTLIQEKFGFAVADQKLTYRNAQLQDQDLLGRSLKANTYEIDLSECNPIFKTT